MLGMEVTVDLLVTASSVRWYGLVLSKDKENVLRKAHEFNGG